MTADEKEAMSTHRQFRYALAHLYGVAERMEKNPEMHGFLALIRLYTKAAMEFDREIERYLYIEKGLPVRTNYYSTERKETA